MRVKETIRHPSSMYATKYFKNITPRLNFSSKSLKNTDFLFAMHVANGNNIY